ncbi:class I SAM-dependent methyltransferase [Nocardioides sp. Soil796]|uniref:class I SAM-dependent methyltransferase n=1 Tax=Nocardioides sp. Soil796 TaxID=1736412 RepID=UPI00070A42B1|nr:class I SAM-dependent methyltransferase [Nocardioides sp. Soil796]KRF18324.1 hypothetical protein ASH02_01840 [Nocardioides sp. Soil796]
MTEPDFLRRTRHGYDTIAADYTATFAGEIEELPFFRAMLTAYAELVLADGGGEVMEVGSGPGETTAFLHDRGLSISGLDLSPEMVRIARADQPHLSFSVGSMLELPYADGALAGVVTWYSLIHLPQERLPDALDEFHRVLRPGGHLAVAFQMGDGVRRIDELGGHAIELDFHRIDPERFAILLQERGFDVVASLVRARLEDEKTPHAHLVARRR